MLKIRTFLYKYEGYCFSKIEILCITKLSLFQVLNIKNILKFVSTLKLLKYLLGRQELMLQPQRVQWILYLRLSRKRHGDGI